jgi:hypothetical protein
MTLVLMVGALICGSACGNAAHGETPPVPTPSTAPSPQFFGLSDASSAVAVGDELILVADDETNVLRLYSLAGGQPLADYDLAAFLAAGAPGRSEADIEASARVGDRVYWISSHGRSNKGKWHAARQRFFATTVRRKEGAAVAVETVGMPFTGLVEALQASPAVRASGFDRAIGPVPEGAANVLDFNIEGMCATASGDRLYIGLRHPRVKVAGSTPRAVVIPFDNPAAVVDSGAAPRFGAPLLWDLGGAGIRSMDYAKAHDAVFVTASSDEGGWALYRWTGGEAAPALVQRLDELGPEFSPEALVTFDGSPDLFLLSDDGSRRFPAGAAACLGGELGEDGSCQNKHLRDPGRRSFRGVRVHVAESPAAPASPAAPPAEAGRR